MQIANEANTVTLKAAVLDVVSTDAYTVKTSATGLTHEGKQVTVFLTFARSEIVKLAGHVGLA